METEHAASLALWDVDTPNLREEIGEYRRILDSLERGCGNDAHDKARVAVLELLNEATSDMKAYYVAVQCWINYGFVTEDELHTFPELTKLREIGVEEYLEMHIV